MACELCDGPGGDLLWQGPLCRIVRVDDVRFPGYCRVVLARHAREMTDLTPAERTEVMRIVFAAEQAVRTAYQPDKVNLASLGNLTPHLHWHVIPRWHDDTHFPDSIWSSARRPAQPRAPAPDARAVFLATLRSLSVST